VTSARTGSPPHEAAPPAAASRARGGYLQASIAGCAIALVTILGLRLVPIGASDLGIAGLFSTDEQLAGQLVQAMIREGNLGLSHFYSYGPLDLYLARALLWPAGRLHSINGEAILVTLRLVSLASGLGSLLLTYLIGRRLWCAWTGTLGTALLAVSTTFLAWSTTAHPDMLQLCLLLGGLLLATSLPARPGRVRLAAACACAGLAFAAKYGGLLLLPPLWLAITLGRALERHRSGAPIARRDIFELGVDVAVSLALFGVAFAVIDPSSLLEPRSFITQVTLESRLAHQGHLFLAVPSPLAWPQRLAANDTLGPVTLAAGLLGLAAFTTHDLRATALRLSRPISPKLVRSASRLPLEAWTIGYLALLIGWFGDVQPRYALPALPGLALCAAAAIIWLSSLLPARQLVLTIAVCAMLAPPLRALAGYERTQAQRMSTPAIADRVAAGRWLAVHAAPATPILHDAYAYIPPQFGNTEETFALTREQIAAFRPRIIVTDAAIRDRFLDPAAAARYQGGRAAYNAAAATYRDLEAGALPCYPLLQRLGPNDVYGAVAPRPTGDGC
jgi:hypothetical protein